MCSSKTFLGRSVWSSAWRKPELLRALTLQEKPWVGGPWSHASLLPVWLFGEQFLGNGWLSRWSERKSEKFHVLHLPVCIMPTSLIPQPAQSLQFPQTDALEQHPLHSPGSPVFPAGQLLSPWAAGSVLSRAPGQMGPANISCHAAVTGSSLTHVPVRQRYSPTQLHSLSALHCAPTPMPSPPCLHVSSACPHRETLCALAAEGKAHGIFSAPGKPWELNKG